MLWKKPQDLGYTISIERLIDQLSDVRKAEIVAVTDLKGKPVKETQPEEMDPELQKLYEELINSV